MKWGFKPFHFWIRDVFCTDRCCAKHPQIKIVAAGRFEPPKPGDRYRVWLLARVHDVDSARVVDGVVGLFGKVRPAKAVCINVLNGI